MFSGPRRRDVFGRLGRGALGRWQRVDVLGRSLGRDGFGRGLRRVGCSRFGRDGLGLRRRNGGWGRFRGRNGFGWRGSAVAGRSPKHNLRRFGRDGLGLRRRNGGWGRFRGRNGFGWRGSDVAGRSPKHNLCGRSRGCDIQGHACRHDGLGRPRRRRLSLRTAGGVARLGRPDQLEHAQHEQHAGSGHDAEDQRFFAQHARSTGRRSATERYAASTTARSRRPDAPSVSGSRPEPTASSNALSIVS